MNTLYKIFYGETVVYIGRTRQPINDRLRGHFYGRAMHRKIDIHQVSKIELAQCETVADMYLYEIYYINVFRPSLNRDDKAPDGLTVSLPPLSWILHRPPLMGKWCIDLTKKEDHEKQVARHLREQALILREQALATLNERRERLGRAALTFEEYYGERKQL